MKKLITISCLLLIVNLSNAQYKIDKKMDKNNRPTIDSGFDILHLEEYKDYLIKDPDNIPIGTTITLPQASKYKIDARDTNSVNKALILQRSIKNK